MAKYAIKIDENSYVKNWSWITDTIPVVFLTVDRIENATLFDDNLENAFKKVYPAAKAIPVLIKTTLIM